MPEFNWTPKNGPTVQYKPLLNEARFGDGYSQRSAKGINNNLQTWSGLQFVDIDEAVLDEIENFLISKSDGSAFTWKPPRKEEAKFICRQYSRRHISKDATFINASFEEVFE